MMPCGVSERKRELLECWPRAPRLSQVRDHSQPKQRIYIILSHMSQPHVALSSPFPGPSAPPSAHTLAPSGAHTHTSTHARTPFLRQVKMLATPVFRV